MGRRGTRAQLAEVAPREGNGVVRTTLPGQIADQIRRRILSGELKEQTQLRQDKLAAEYSVSRIPIREALLQLEAEGLVVSSPHRGAVVNVPSPVDIREVFELRALIECDLMRLAMPHITDEHLARADQVVRASYGPVEDLSAFDWGELNWQFHSALYAAANRPLTMEILRKLFHSAYRYHQLHMVITGAVQKARHDHRRLVELCAEKRTDEAVNFLRHHILQAGEALIARLTQVSDEKPPTL
jgi:DNA-binding GntR family transcriptional regulator